MKKALMVLGGALIALTVVLIARTATYHSRQVPVEPAPALALDSGAAAERLAGALRFATVSFGGSVGVDTMPFHGLQSYLEHAFPRAHASLTRERVGGLALLYRWAGSDTTLQPILLLAHQDVVPVEPGTESRWTEPPFAGRIAGGYVWGRGAPRHARRPARVRRGRGGGDRARAGAGCREGGRARRDRREGVPERRAHGARGRRALVDAARRDGGGDAERGHRSARAPSHARRDPWTDGQDARLPRPRDAVRDAPGAREPLAVRRPDRGPARCHARGERHAAHHHRADHLPGGGQGQRPALRGPRRGELPAAPR